MTQFILIPAITEEKRNNKLLTAYTMPAGPLSEQDRAALDKQRSLITFPLQELGLTATGFRAIDSVRRLLADQGQAFGWLDSQRLYCSGKCEGSSAELGMALALLLRDRTGEFEIIATGALGGAGNKITIETVAKIPEKLQLVLEQQQAGKLGDKKTIFITPQFYKDLDGENQPIKDLPITFVLAEIGVDVIPISQLSEILQIPGLLVPANSTINNTLPMQKIIINHILGAKTRQAEIIDITDAGISFGRDESCQVVFDPEKDDSVSRVHCKIDIKNGNQFFLTDLNSSNGTYVNDTKITTPTELAIGDTIQLGKDGPLFSVDLDPSPQQSPLTRLDKANSAAQETRVMDTELKKTVEQNQTLPAQKILIKHSNSSKANQSETIDVTGTEILIGRDASCRIIFDPEKDDAVSRIHCKIDIKNGNQFFLTDLNSRNGTYINGNKITSPTELYADDKVQLSQYGPQFSFDLASKPQKPKPIPREDNSATVPVMPVKGATPSKNTVERMITQSESATRKKIITVGAGILGMISLILAYFGYQTYQNGLDRQQTKELVEKVKQAQLPQQKDNQLLSAADIFKQYGNSSVMIEASWKLIHTVTGKQVFQKQDCFLKEGKCITGNLPWYIQHNGIVEPYLDVSGIAIGQSLSGSGFVVHEDGFILTNRHVAANWHAQGHHFQLPGILVDCNDAACSKPDYKILDEKTGGAYLASLHQWIPSKTKMLGQKPVNGKIVEGRNDYLEVTFPESGLRIPARLVRTSDTADVAMIKIDLPQKLQPTQLNAETPVSPGDTITVMGYPGISPDVLAKMRPQDPIGGEGEIRSIPKPTVTTGNIGKVLNGAAKADSEAVSELYSSMGDVYQLTVNATGSGNSGGPVFNDKGQVIGLFTYGKSDQSGTQISFAVPIKYGRELMDITTIK